MTTTQLAALWTARFGHIEIGFMLEGLYSSDDRYYHNVNHILECLDKLVLFSAQCEHEEEVALAIFFHDVIYNTHDHNNEENSARLFEALASPLGRSGPQKSRVTSMILRTKHTYGGVECSLDEKVMMDIDLAPLASDEFDRDEANIRKEYAWVPEDIFWNRRAEFLMGLLAQPHIFHTEFGRKTYEAKARQNIAHSISRNSALSLDRWLMGREVAR